jgi:uncharacterized protein YkuJ
MKTVFFLAFSFLFFSCQPVTEKNSAAIQPISDVVKQNLLKIIEGGWVNEEYIKALKASHSPMSAAASGIYIQQMAFDISNVSGDTLLNVIGRLNSNESEKFDVIFYKKPGGKEGMKLVENREDLSSSFGLNYLIEKNDTILTVDFHEGNNSHTMRYRRQFRKFLPADEIQVTAMEFFVNKTLFTGKWLMNGKEILFSEKGEVKNFGNYQHFSVSTVEQEPASRPDEISFYNDSTGITYAFTVRNNTIDLFEISGQEDGMHFSRGKMIGEMKRE